MLSANLDNSTVTSYINVRALEVVNLMIEEELLLHNIQLNKHVERCKNAILNKTINKDYNNVEGLLINLGTYNLLAIEQEVEEENKNNPTLNHCNPLQPALPSTIN